MDELEHPLIGASTNSRAAYSEDEVLQKVLEGSKNDDDGSQYATTHDNKDRIFTQHKCLKCKETSKCPSDFKKHMLKHDKPHTCDYPNCRRAAPGKGFTTVNDLQRHKRSVHRIGVEKDSYRCASEHCRNHGKIWPRLDNFKQYISRMHKGEDDQDPQSSYMTYGDPARGMEPTLDQPSAVTSSAAVYCHVG